MNEILNINPISVAKLFLSRIKSEYPQFDQHKSPSELEKVFNIKLFESFLSILDNHHAIIENEIILDNELPSEASEDDEDDEDKNFRSTQSFSKIKLVVKMAKEHPAWAYKTLENRTGVKNISKKYITSWERIIHQGGYKKDLLKEIDEYAWEKFQEARASYKIIKSIDIQRWALSKSIQFPNFKFLPYTDWASKFKKKHHLGSRKITQLVSSKKVKGT